MPSMPRFQFSDRWHEIMPILKSNSPEDVEIATDLLERRDRQMEDAWPAGGGGTAQSLISEDTHLIVANLDNTTKTQDDTFAVVIPATTGLTYHLAVAAHTIAVVHDFPLDPTYIQLYGWFQINEQSPGGGFENYGFFHKDVIHTASFPDGIIYTRTFHGERDFVVNAGLVGTTIHLKHTYTTDNFGLLAARNVTFNGQVEIKLFAIPT